MNSKLKKLFKNIEKQEIPVDLKEKILKKVAAEKSWQKKKRLIFADILSLCSLGALVFVFVNWGNELLKSEFWNLARLLFSDTAIVADHWKDFLFSLLETFPAIYIVAFLAPIFFFLVSLNYYLGSINNHNHHHAKT